MAPKRTDPATRFWRYVEKTDGCWEWRGYRTTRQGYGSFTPIWNGSPVPAHRYAYELVVGPIPTGLQLDHLCRNRGCVRPDHLEPVTPRENVLRGIGLTARFAQATHCVKGHPFEGRNLIRRRNGGRACRECRLTYLRRYRRERLAEGVAA